MPTDDSATDDQEPSADHVSAHIPIPAESRFAIDGSEVSDDNNLPPADDRAIIPVIGLGGSAGSVAEIVRFFTDVPSDLGVAFVVVIHLSPDHESHMPEILRAKTRMPVIQVKGTEKIKADHVYVIPPAYHLTMFNGSIRLSEPERQVGKRVAVDMFFRSLAATHRSRALAIVLSGTDGDGAIGIKQIKEAGGVTVAQDPGEAEYSGIPQSAIETGMVDWILPVSQMAGKVTEWIRNEERIEFPPDEKPFGQEFDNEHVDEKALREVLAFLHTRTGHDFTHYKRATVLRRIMRRLRVNSLESIPLYSNFLRTHPGESGALLQDLLISVTNFFRDPDAFKAFTANVPRLFRNKLPNDAVRVWIPGCATGEEAYSLAMILLEHAETMDSPPELQLFATDMDDLALRCAREGYYPETISADVSPERLKRFFVLDQGRYRVKKEVRERILFASHNLLRDAPFSRLDFVSCRNLLIYFDREAQNKVFDVFHFALKSAGLLLLGGSESADESPLFATVDKKYRIYERQAVARTHLTLPNIALPMLPRLVDMAALARATATLPMAENRRAESNPISFAELHLKLIEQSAPPSILVNANYEIVHLSDRAGYFLRFVGGEISTNLLSVIHPALRLELRTALFRASQNREEVDAPLVSLEVEGEIRQISMQVRSLEETSAADGASNFLLIIFEEPKDGKFVALPSTTPDETARRLEAELQHLKSYLRASVEQYEASSEELKASNEELQAMNEEQRSAAEELETSREEIQAANEELLTLNQELKSKIDELSRTNSDLQNLMASTEVATVFLTRDFRIKRYTPPSVDMFRIIPTDVGRPLEDLRHQFENATFIEDAQQVLRTLVTMTREVKTVQGEWYLLRISPYRTTEDHIDGVVLSFVDITATKEAIRALESSEERYRAIVTQMNTGIIHANLQGDLIYANRRFCQLVGQAEGEVIGHSIFDFTISENVEESRRLFNEMMEEGRSFEFETRMKCHDGKRIWVSVSVTAMRDANGHPWSAAATIIDIDRRKHAESEILERQEELQRKARLDSLRAELADALRPLPDPAQILEAASRVMGEGLAVSRAAYHEVREDAAGKECIVVEHDYHSPDVKSFIGNYASDLFGAKAFELLAAGTTLAVGNIDNDPALTPKGRIPYHEAEIHAYVAVPLVKSGKFVAIFAVHQSVPRTWAADEIAFVEETAERTWSAVERARVEQALRESEGKFRAVFETIDEGYCVAEVLLDDRGTPVDYRFVEANPNFEKLTGLDNPVGKTALEMVPDLESFWIETYGNVALSGESTRFEHESEAMGLWFDVYCSRLGGPGSRTIAIVFREITESRRRETNLLFLSDIAARFTTPEKWEKLIHAAGSGIKDHFGFATLSFIEFTEIEDEVVNLYDSRGPEGGAGSGKCRLADYFSEAHIEKLRSGEVLSIGDVTNAGIANGGAAYQELGISSIITAPYLANGQMKFLIGGIRSGISSWRTDENDLMRELAAQIYLRLERSRAEDALRGSEERLRIAVESAEMGTWDWSIPDDLVRWDDQYFLLLGLESDKSPKSWKTFVEHIHPEDQANVESRLRFAMDHASDFDDEFRIIRADTGEIRWMSSFGRTFESKNSVASRMTGVMYDSTDRRLAAEKLQKANDELESRVEKRTRDLGDALDKLRMESAERQKTEQARMDLLKRVVNSQEEERRRISRELHDNLGQHMVAMLLQVETIQKTTESGLQDGSSVTAFTKLRKVADELIKAVHRQAWELRPAELDHLGLEAAMEHYVKDWSERTGIPLDFRPIGKENRRFQTEIEIAFYRVVQEALTNVARHAEATQVTVTLEFNNEASVCIEDNGRGFDPAAIKGRLGLLGMKERLSIVGGMLVIDSAPGEGTRIAASVPTP